MLNHVTKKRVNEGLERQQAKYEKHYLDFELRGYVLSI
jgi:hypothetical protein